MKQWNIITRSLIIAPSKKIDRLSANDPTDGTKKAENGYTNFEHYLNELTGDSASEGGE